MGTFRYSSGMTPIAVPCQTNCNRAQATACAAGCRKNVSIAGIVITADLLVVARVVYRLANVLELLCGRPFRRERLHHELPGRTSERAVQQIAHELPLRRFFTETGAVDVGPVSLVALHESLFRHDLQQFERRGVDGPGPFLGEQFVDVPDRAGTALPEDAQDRQLGVSGARGGRS